MSLFKKKFFKVVTVYLLISILGETLFPTIAYALTSGPQQPEFTSFEPVSTTNMVSEFTGDFTYNLPVVNVPGPNGGGYALSLSYHSGASPEEEASWVGYGWTLNPGAINRGKKGFPDDYNGEDVTYKNKQPRNWTASVGYSRSLEFYSVESVSLLSASASAAVKYNNYKGFGTVYSVGLATYEGLASVNYSVSGEDGHSFSADINPAAFFVAKQSKARREAQKHYFQLHPTEKRAAVINAEQNKILKDAIIRQKSAVTVSRVMGGLASHYGVHSFGDEFRPSNVQKYSGTSFNLAFNFEVDPMPPVHFGVKSGLSGSFSEQTTEPSLTHQAYGFLYNADGAHAIASNRMMDYSVEHENIYCKRDKYLSVPYQSPDQFSLTGEGLGGGFRLYSKKLGHYYPRNESSSTYIANLGFDFTTGGVAEPYTGFSVGGGKHTLDVQNWFNPGNSGDFSFYDTNPPSNTEIETNFFRFNGDLGGNVIYSESDDAYRASVVNLNNITGNRTYKPNINDKALYTELKERNGRSSFIGFHTMEEMNVSQGNLKIRSFIKDNPSINDEPWDMVNRGQGNIGKRIGEIATYNEDGNKYVYGLPVFAAKEKNLSYSVKDKGSPGYTLESNHIIYKDITGGTNTEVGEIKDAPYATSFLLTEITTPDFIDRTYNGPTYDDFGGWTKFNYKRGEAKNENVYGDRDKTKTDNWYKWRFPYNGLNYDRGEICDARDDMGRLTSGVKEIYYLKSVETKTHVAYFITNKTDINVEHSSGTPVSFQGSTIRTGQGRKDGLGAANDDEADGNKSAQDKNQELERLEKIVIYAKNENNQLVGKPLKTVHLEYNYEIWKNIPNNINYDPTGLNINSESGKLTLKKVWFEYEGIVNAKITPYEFNYQYQLGDKVTSADLLSKYKNTLDAQKDIIGYGGSLNQSPIYNQSCLDAWGNWGYNMPFRNSSMRPWLFQGKNTSDFDPAAYQLKVIKLPSGGEIHVQYEQHEYSYVQDKEALTMISLKDRDGGTVDKSEIISDNKYYLNLDDIDLDMNNDGNVDNDELNDYADKCSTFINDKVYFKFLYDLIGKGSPDINGCSSEYIDGYVKVTEVKVDPGHGIYLSLDRSGYTFPRKVCLDYVKRNKAGLDISSDCDVLIDGGSEGTAVSIVKGLVNKLGTDFNGEEQNCKEMSLKYSYFRLPLMKAKKGGGVRVKRILMYDTGLEAGANGDEVLYGTEYIYKNEDGTSSGVATNEPIREENALVSSLDKRAEQKWYQKIISGTDKEQFEGPIGESLLPSPSVGYSRVISKNIHSGKTSTGYKVSEYHTFKEPEFAFSNNLNRIIEIDEHAKDYLYVPAIWVNLTVDNRWLSHGYSFVLNSMHGKIKRTAVYGGDYIVGEEANKIPTFEEIYEYFKPGEKVPVMDEKGKVCLEYMGKEMDVTMEMKSVDDIQNDLHVQVDFTTSFLFIPIFSYSAFPYYTYHERKLRTHVTSKVINYPSILKSVKTTQDGIVHWKDYKVFNKASGQPIVTVDYDGYNGLTMEKSSSHKGTYTNYNIPAHVVYKNFGPRSQNQGYAINFNASITTDDLSKGKYSFPLSDPSLISKGLLVSGDLIKLYDGTNLALYYISGFDGNIVRLQSCSATTPINSFTNLEVINSGYTNQLNVSAGSIMTYGTDYTNNTLPPSHLMVSGGNISLNNMDNVLSASVKTFNDDWKNDNVNSDFGLLSNNNDFETGRRGKWRQLSDYVYKTDIKDAVTGDNRVYNGGVYNSFTGFNFTNPSSNDDNKWLRTNLVTAYSPNGNALEEQNILGIKSAAKFSHNESVPALLVHNAPYTSVIFKSFEDVSGANTLAAHSGSYSWLLSANGTYSPGSIIMNDQIRNYGISSKLWIKTPDQYDLTYFKGSLSDGNAAVVGLVKQIARVGEWTLVEVKFQNTLNGFTNGSTLTLNLQNTYSDKVSIDDVRIQPLDAQMTCYVYDKQNLRLLGTFDDQHFGMYYQYNAEGQLVRKLVETERGLKTITETQYNTSVK